MKKKEKIEEIQMTAEEFFKMTPESLLLAIWSLTKVPPDVSPRESILRCIERIADDWYDNFREAEIDSENNSNH